MNILSAKSRFASYDITSVSYICIILSASASNCFKSDVSALPKTALFGILFRFVHLNNQKPINCNAHRLACFFGFISFEIVRCYFC